MRIYHIVLAIIITFIGFKIWPLDEKPTNKIQLASEILAKSENRKFAWTERAKASVKSRLKDPDSAKFRKVYFNKGTNGVPTTCGEVNSKNSYGAYGGFQKFVSAGKPELTFLQEQVSDFNTIWNKFCL